MTTIITTTAATITTTVNPDPTTTLTTNGDRVAYKTANQSLSSQDISNINSMTKKKKR